MKEYAMAGEMTQFEPFGDPAWFEPLRP